MSSVLWLSSCATEKVVQKEKMTAEKFPIIPKPLKVESGEGSFTADESIVIVYGQADSLKQLAEYLQEKIQPYVPEVSVFAEKKAGQKALLLNIDSADKEYGAEGYRLAITEKSITLSAARRAGLFYGIQSLLQVLPESEKAGFRLPVGTVFDRPRFKWRGMLLDCGRHFMKKDFVKRYIDLLAGIKMNRLHWHLTEDQGWRIEIKKYPRLTEIGAWRKYEDGTVYGGFYTQDDIREVVAYAKSRFVTVVPEIEMPGHSTAALAAYPQFSCTGGPFEVSTLWGVHKDIYCAGNDSVFTFLQDVLDEVIDLFPSKYIHIGGDEAPKARWRECGKCQQRIKDEGLADEHELQSYFIRRIGKYLNSRGKRLIGWDEILEGGLAPDATVQSWRGVDGALAAARSGHDAIVSPTTHAYFDYKVYKLDMRKVYEFDPVPEGLEPEFEKHILGGECNVWTERIPQEKVDYMVFPRILAMSENLWSAKEKDSFAAFLKRVDLRYPALKNMGVTWGPEASPVRIQPELKSDEPALLLNLIAGYDDLEIYYSTDGQKADKNAKRYEHPLRLTQSSQISIQSFLGDRAYGETGQLSFNRHLAFGKEVQIVNANSDRYPGSGEYTLTDGIHGTQNFRDGLWLGFQGEDFEAVIDLQQETGVSKISVNFLNNIHSWLFLPPQVEFYLSTDGENFQPAARIRNDLPLKTTDDLIKTFRAQFPALQARYVKIVGKYGGDCPSWHPGYGGKSWLFVDEIVVE